MPPSAFSGNEPGLRNAVTNLLGEPPETFLPEDPGAADLAGGTPARDVVAAQPASVLGWARLAEEQLNDGSNVEGRSEEHTSELQSRGHLVCRLLLEKKK